MARLIALAGLPGVGKSSIAQHLARRCGAIWLRIDSMDQAIWASGTAPKDLLDWSYRAAQAVAADNLALGWDIIADCVNDCQEARDGWEAIGQRTGAQVKWLEVVCSDPVEHRRRIETRSIDIRGLALPDWHAVVLRAYDDWNRGHLSSTRHIAIWTCASTRPSTSCVDEVRCWHVETCRPTPSMPVHWGSEVVGPWSK
jgi:predicted kinase